MVVYNVVCGMGMKYPEIKLVKYIRHAHLIAQLVLMVFAIRSNNYMNLCVLRIAHVSTVKTFEAKSKFSFTIFRASRFSNQKKPLHKQRDFRSCRSVLL